MFGWKRRNDVLLATLLERILDRLDTVVDQNRQIIEGERTIMASQDDFNAKVAELDGILDVFRAGYAAQKQVIANLTAEVDQAKNNKVNVSAIDPILAEAREIMASMEAAIDPNQDTPAADTVPTVDPVDGAEAVEAPPAVTVQDIVGPLDAPTSGTAPTETGVNTEAGGRDGNGATGTEGVPPGVDPGYNTPSGTVSETGGTDAVYEGGVAVSGEGNDPTAGVTSTSGDDTPGPGEDQAPVAERENPPTNDAPDADSK